MHARMCASEERQRACVYLSMNMSALGTLWSPRCTTLLPTHCPRRCWQRHRMAAIALATPGACCTRLSPCARDKKLLAPLPVGWQGSQTMPGPP